LRGAIDVGQRQWNAGQHESAFVLHDTQHAVVAGDVPDSVAIAIRFVGNLPDQFAGVPVDYSCPYTNQRCCPGNHSSGANR